jgi:hypothetical protein
MIWLSHNYQGLSLTLSRPQFDIKRRMVVFRVFCLGYASERASFTITRIEAYKKNLHDMHGCRIIIKASVCVWHYQGLSLTLKDGFFVEMISLVSYKSV